MYQSANEFCNDLDFRMIRLNERHNAFGGRPCSTSSKVSMADDTVYDAMKLLNQAFKHVCEARSLMRQLAEIEGGNDFGNDGYGLYAIEPLPNDKSED